ncbi:hypothetical protein F8388_016534 [Cannabis sativa]|uniref:Proliferating cell nuclear antigen PCNA N-terminal domain-containing protein n=1 Tax=Cannabis sativa TaxID=3483 RepID=A0A7J6E681_CANSA|nr:hypothetical protein G4B88_018800 [Cannabis sativa]KAF4363406.1 hypothetical protein F8388_016534 [Cannabis sativa]
MLELRLVQGLLLKKLVVVLKDLVTDANFDCLAIGSEGFEHYWCDRNLSMGMNFNNSVEALLQSKAYSIISHVAHPIAQQILDEANR